MWTPSDALGSEFHWVVEVALIVILALARVVRLTRVEHATSVSRCQPSEPNAQRRHIPWLKQLAGYASDLLAQSMGRCLPFREADVKNRLLVTAVLVAAYVSAINRAHATPSAHQPQIVASSNMREPRTGKRRRPDLHRDTIKDTLHFVLRVLSIT